MIGVEGGVDPSKRLALLSAAEQLLAHSERAEAEEEGVEGAYDLPDSEEEL